MNNGSFNKRFYKILVIYSLVFSFVFCNNVLVNNIFGSTGWYAADTTVIGASANRSTTTHNVDEKAIKVKYSVPDGLSAPNFGGSIDFSDDGIEGLADVGDTVTISNLIPDNLISKGWVKNWEEDINSSTGIQVKKGDNDVTAKAVTAQWDGTNQKISFTMPDDPVIVTIPITKEYTVTFDEKEGTRPSGNDAQDYMQKVKHGECATAPKNDPTHPSGYKFVGWYEISDATTIITGKTTKITENKTFYAVYQDPSLYSVIFYNNDGSDKIVKAFSNIALDTPWDKIDGINDVLDNDPTRDGYNFMGWGETKDSKDAVLNFPDKVTGNLVYYAIWEEPKYEIVYYENNGLPTENTYIDNNNNNFYTISGIEEYKLLKHDNPKLQFGKSGKVFKGWALTREPGDDDEILKAGDKLKDGVASNKTINNYIVLPKAGEEGSPRIEVFAVWASMHKVSYDLAGGERPKGAVYGESVMHGEKATKPQDPIPPDGKEFLYWALEGKTTEYNFNTPVTRDIILFAQYKALGDSGTEPPPVFGGSEDDNDLFIEPPPLSPEVQRPEKITITVNHKYNHYDGSSHTVHSDVDDITVPIHWEGGIARIAVKDIIDQSCKDCNDEVIFENYQCVFDKNQDGYVSDDLIRILAEDEQDGSLSMGGLIIDMIYNLYNQDVNSYQIVHEYTDIQSNTKYTVTTPINRDDVSDVNNINIEDYINTVFEGKEYVFDNYSVSYNEETKTFIILIKYKSLAEPMAQTTQVLDTGIYIKFSQLLILMMIALIGCWMVNKKTKKD